MKLIDKEKVVVEIEKKLQDLITCKENTSFTEQRVVLWAKIDMCNEILSILDTLEVKEVDLEKEMDFVKDAYYYFTSDEIDGMMKVARYFFELGLKTKKGE